MSNIPDKDLTMEQSEKALNLRIDEFLELSHDERNIIEKYTFGNQMLNEYQQNVYKMYLIKNEFIKQYLKIKNEYEINKEYIII